jgi:hypothetical protein
VTPQENHQRDTGKEELAHHLTDAQQGVKPVGRWRLWATEPPGLKFQSRTTSMIATPNAGADKNISANQRVAEVTCQQPAPRNHPMWPPAAHIRLDGEVKKPDQNGGQERKIYPGLKQAQFPH